MKKNTVATIFSVLIIFFVNLVAELILKSIIATTQFIHLVNSSYNNKKKL